ncbi:sulfotransferase domain-containing protein [Blastococcus sp. MG754426]|uniref:sulfotransferase n=1 Tax=unclassified Blastococcus TaxID=2619396 RepID=UPI001EF02BE6|nr:MULTISPECIES: sulfotransferase [unclassified Blastococcus]MCF6508552.1 sulfotransferase domain-containing protein [Blastococcus sp. MG754426]MCF6510743.1 sulfotransferase domain-containing protein [Blastococcus sp. MG754427]MCF6734307.1 sulfotransferase domain-containing protein [Blastococcus sp. KM273129]
MRPGPRLMIVGAPKSGSTALFHYLAQHPDVRSHVHREMPFFGRGEEVARGWAHAVEKYFPPSVGDAPLLAKHTMAMYDPAAVRRIADTTPAVVVAVLRAPVPRAYSHFHYARLRGWEDAATFEEGLAREPGRAVSAPPRARDMQYVGNGIYAPHVRALLETVPPERLRIYLSDDLRADAVGICAELFDLAGLPPHVPDATAGHNEGRSPRSASFARAFLAAQRPGSPARRLLARVPSRTLYRVRHLVNRLNEGPAAFPPMAPATAAALHERFAGPNEDLAAALGRSLGAWRS